MELISIFAFILEMYVEIFSKLSQDGALLTLSVSRDSEKHLTLESFLRLHNYWHFRLHADNAFSRLCFPTFNAAASLNEKWSR